ncbi:hypothetical protein ABZY19_22065 [Streptomyces sp. NPDC006475]|uniref:hypothetical protein n=1 Tax=Streptomyces sp. NPDC006475 TaxID=3155719 RepID=UPI0033ACCB1C
MTGPSGESDTINVDGDEFDTSRHHAALPHWMDPSLGGDHNSVKRAVVGAEMGGRPSIEDFGRVVVPSQQSTLVEGEDLLGGMRGDVVTFSRRNVARSSSPASFPRS